MADGCYARHPAPPDLGGYVEALWTAEASHGAVPSREILIPNGRPALVVALGDPGTRHDPLTGTAHPNDGVLFGITTRPYVLEQSGRSSYAGAQLAPWGLAALLPRERLVDTFLPLASWLGAAEAARLADDLRGREPGRARAGGLAAFVAARLTPIAPGTLEALRAAVGLVDAAHGAVGVAGLAGKAGVSYSTLYRLFTANLGLPPKRYCELIRYYHGVGALLRGGDAGRALAGYYDQAHAARDFKRFTGVSASSFKRIHHGIARLMHQPDPAA
ncbi:helix-turn-helix domain-containing protein [Sphaerisporangium aureirubrum]|uniref:Helix-turn-helix domain-containing protein n=1 Tax=Sphaerisporangium aureirubrum TaxID=1544736 RepID=A0ABW1N8E6_9ACTN